jgi:hypothetical protein
MKGRTKIPLGSAAGTGLVLAILILAALSILGTSIALVAMNDRNLSKYDKESMEALAAAETGLAFAKRAIKDQEAPMTDVDHDGRPDFAMSDSMSWGDRKSVV